MNYSEEMKLFQETEAKLETLLSENNLVHTFHIDKYPIYLSITQNMDPSAQMEMFDTSNDGVSARDAKLNFIFRDGEILVRTDSRLIIPDSLMSKIKGLAKKMHYLYLQAFFHGIAVRRDSGDDFNEPDDEDDTP